MIGIAILVAAGVFLYQYPSTDRTPEPSRKVHQPIRNQAVIDYDKLDKDESLKQLITARKEKYGMDEGVDIIAQPDETLKVGDTTIKMQEILDQVRLKQGDILEETIEADQSTGVGKTSGDGDVYGIYVVQRGDNIWNIHFKFLKDYARHRGISISPLADEPNQVGYSSGIGKLLKFSEKMVYIYNIKKKQLDVNLGSIQPFSKIVVYNMTDIFRLLDSIDYDKINHIQFDGETIWIPAEQ
ncbi:MAG: hypothetical protein QNI95_03765 [Desulfobacterales bacterium]|nr:hypothetical protein [Desulfobacterales bacterium]